MANVCHSPFSACRCRDVIFKAFLCGPTGRVWCEKEKGWIPGQISLSTFEGFIEYACKPEV